MKKFKSRAQKDHSLFCINSKGQIVHIRHKRLPATGISEIGKHLLFTSTISPQNNGKS